MAHRLTMALAFLGVFIQLAAVAEPLIALTIVQVSLENLFAKFVRTPHRYWIARNE